MVNVCAWCDRFLGVKEPMDNSAVTHGICRSCFARQTWDETPVVVISPEREHLAATLADVLRGLPEIKVVVDRRRVESDVRHGGERRQRPAIMVT
jgi:hypothetical protein